MWNNYIAAGCVHHNCGKTITAFILFCLWLRDHAKNGEVYWLIAASLDSIKGVPLRTIWGILPRSMFGGWHYHPQSNLPTTIPLWLPDGRGVIELKPMTENQDLQEFEQERLSGWLWSECRREAVFGALQPRMVAHGAFGIMDYIPIEPWHRELEENARIPGSMVHHVRMAIVENQHNLSAGAVHDMKPKALGGRGTMSVEEWKLRGEGLPAAYEGVVFKQFDPDVHMHKAFKVPEYLPLFMGADWGYRNPHAFLLAVCMPDETVIGLAEEYDNECTVFEVCKRLWVMVDSHRAMKALGGVDAMFQALLEEQAFAKVRMLEDPAAEKEGRIRRPVRDHIRAEWKRVLAAPCVIDASIFDRDQADGSALSDHFDACGFPVVRSVKENKAGGVELIRRKLEQRQFFLFDACAKTRRDLMTWRYKENKDRIPDPADRFEAKNDHGVAAVMYLLRSGLSHHRPGGDDAAVRSVYDVLDTVDGRTGAQILGRVKNKSDW